MAFFSYNRIQNRKIFKVGLIFILILQFKLPSNAQFYGTDLWDDFGLKNIKSIEVYKATDSIQVFKTNTPSQKNIFSESKKIIEINFSKNKIHDFIEFNYTKNGDFLSRKEYNQDSNLISEEFYKYDSLDNLIYYSKKINNVSQYFYYTNKYDNKILISKQGVNESNYTTPITYFSYKKGLLIQEISIGEQGDTISLKNNSFDKKKRLIESTGFNRNVKLKVRYTYYKKTNLIETAKVYIGDKLTSISKFEYDGKQKIKEIFYDLESNYKVIYSLSPKKDFILVSYYYENQIKNRFELFRITYTK